MALLYILLIIIAIGVLLMSREGKELLGIITILACIAGGLYVGFWLIMFVFALIFSGDLRESIRPVLIFFVCIFYVIAIIWYLIHLWKIRKQIPNKIKQIPTRIKNYLLQQWEKERVGSIIGIAGIVAIIAVIIWTFMAGVWSS